MEETPEEQWSLPFTDIDASHGRITERSIKVATVGVKELDFPGARSIAVTTYQTTFKKTGKDRNVETVAKISSLVEPTPELLLDVSRNHWFIENGFHNILDGTFQEDRQRMHTGQGSMNMTSFRSFAISCKNLLGQPSMPDAQHFFQQTTPTILQRMRSSLRFP